jgi:hypothetical protein
MCFMMCDHLIQLVRSNIILAFALNLSILCVLLCGIYVFSHCIGVINRCQKLMCPIRFQSLLVLLDPPNGTLQSKVEKHW